MLCWIMTRRKWKVPDFISQGKHILALSVLYSNVQLYLQSVASRELWGKGVLFLWVRPLGMEYGTNCRIVVSSHSLPPA